MLASSTDRRASPGVLARLLVAALISGGMLGWGHMAGVAHAASIPISVDWPQFQGSPAHLGAAEAASLSPPLRQRWTFRDPESRLGLPGAVTDGDVVVALGEKDVYGLDPQTGQELWRVERNGGPLVTPAIGASGDTQVLVFTEGERSATAAVVAVDMGTRAELWRHTLRHPSASGVTIDGDTALLGDTTGNVYGFDLSSGDALSWSPKGLGGGSIEVPLAAENGEAFAVTTDQDTGEIRVIALKESSGQEDWDFAPRLGSGASGVTVNGNDVFFGVGGELRVHSVLSVDGRENWSTRTRSSFSTLSAPAFADGDLFVLATSIDDAVLYRMDGTDGSKVWDFQFQDPSLRSSPVVVGDTAYVGLDDGRVAGIDLPSGVEVWEDDAGTGVVGPIAVLDDELIVSSRGTGGGLVAYEHDPDGTLIHVESPTKLKLEAVLARYAMALVAVFVVAFGGARAVRRVGLGRNEGEGDDEPEPEPPVEED